MLQGMENSIQPDDRYNTSHFQILYLTIVLAFCILVVISNLISAKLVTIPFFNFILPAGLITYPITFIMSDFVTEIFGIKKAKLMIHLTLAMNLLAFAIIEIALLLPAVDERTGIAFQSILGLSGLRIFASIVGFICSQMIDVQMYALIKHWTGSKFLWLRNNGATCIAQFVDTVIIDMLYLYWGLQMNLSSVIPIMLLSYLYKMTFSVACTPLFYLSVYLSNKNWDMKRSLVTPS